MSDLTQFLRRAVQINGAGIATICEGRTRSWTDFEQRISRLAGALTEMGLAKGSRVGILALNSDRYLELYFALAWAGLVFVPINTRLMDSEIRYWLEDSGCSALFLDREFSQRGLEIVRSIPEVEHIIIMDEAPGQTMLRYEALIESGPSIDPVPVEADSLAGIFYTGGTTGRSKGVMLSHANIVANALHAQSQFDFGPDTAWIHAGPMFHLADGAATFLVTAVGGRHLFVPKFNVVDFLRAVEQGGTDTLAVPTLLIMILEHPELPTFDTRSLRTFICGGAPLPEAIVKRALELLPGTSFIQVYGQTEAAPIMTLNPRENNVTTGSGARHMGSVGRAVIGCEVKIVDTEGRQVATGDVGEIVGRGSNIMLGYWGLKELTRSTLRDGWLHTGDSGYMDRDGYVYIVDRLKDMIISGGENIYSIEIENVLYEYPGVTQCAVIGVPHPKWGEAVHAVVKINIDAPITVDELMAYCRSRLASFKCPRSLELVTHDLPRSGAGKIMKADLRKAAVIRADSA